MTSRSVVAVPLDARRAAAVDGPVEIEGLAHERPCSARKPATAAAAAAGVETHRQLARPAGVQERRPRVEVQKHHRTTEAQREGNLAQGAALPATSHHDVARQHVDGVTGRTHAGGQHQVEVLAGRLALGIEEDADGEPAGFVRAAGRGVHHAGGPAAVEQHPAMLGDELADLVGVIQRAGVAVAAAHDADDGASHDRPFPPGGKPGRRSGWHPPRRDASPGGQAMTVDPSRLSMSVREKT